MNDLGILVNINNADQVIQNEVIKMHAYGTKETRLELCEKCIRKMWKQSF